MKKKLHIPVGTLLKVFILFCGITGSMKVSAQNITNKGTDFWVGYGHHQFMENGTNSMDMVLYLSNTENQAAIVTVTIDSSGPLPTTPWKRVYNIPANTVISTGTQVATSFSPATIGSSGPMPKTGAYDARLYTLAPPISTGGAGIFRKKGIHITSTTPIVAYAHIYGSASSGATMLLPTNAWGYSYMSVNSNQEYAANCYSWMYVIAKENNTRVEITCPVLTRASNLTGIKINQPFYVTLNKGQMYQIIGANTGSDADGNGGTASTGRQLTGTRVRSIANAAGDCYPIAVFSGSSRTTGDANCGSGGGDNDNQQCFPMEAWGKRYLTAPTSNSTSPSSFMTNLYKIAVKDPTTVVKRNGAIISQATLQNNAYYYFETNTADYIEADKPIMVAQFLSGGCLSGVGDPEMMYLSPIEQAINKVGFYRNTLESIDFNYLTLIIPTQGLNSLRIDGTLFNSLPAVDRHSYPHPNLSGYSVAIRRWASAQAQSFAESDSSFNAVTYGLGSVESYGYNAGTYLNNLNIKPAIRNVIDTTKKEHPFTCTETNFDLNILVAYKPTYIGWDLTGIPAISPNANVSLGSTLPFIPPIDSVSIDGRWYYRYQAPGGPYKFSAIGSYTIPVRLSHPAIENCYHSETLNITVDVKQKPIADFTYTHSGCLADSVRFNGPNATTTGSSYTIKYWNWKFDDGTTDIRQNPGHLYLIGGTSYPVKLQVASAEGCLSDTVTKNVVVGAGPQAKFTVNPANACEGQVVTLTPDATLSSSQFIWIYGDPNKKNDTLSANTPVQVTYNSFGKKYIQLKLAAVGGCNPSSVDSVMVWAKPVIGFQYPVGCLPSNGIVTFTDTTKIPDGTTISTRQWYFADPAAAASNPNTSTTNPASHTYAVGTYNGIKLTVTTDKGCTKDSTFNATFNISPSLSFPAVSDVCENAQPFNLTGSVTNLVPGQGIFKSFKNAVTSGLYDPKIAGAGVDTVWYVYTATSGCVDSLKQWFTVKPSPKVGFEYPQGGCLNASGAALFNDTTKIAAPASITSIAWNFGDNGTATTSPVTHNYTADGTYTIKLKATANNGCVDSLSVTAGFTKKPALTFPALADVCENIVPFNVNIVPAPSNGVTGTGIYKSYKNAVTNANTGLYDPKIAGVGVDTVYYVYTTTGGCVDSVKQWFTIKASPKVGFQYPQGGCLNANGSALFVDTTKIATPATIASIAWNFGDNGTATTSPVTHNYTADGTYTIKLKATANNACVDSLSITATFSKKPALTFPALSDVCENVVPFNVNIVPAPSNGVTGSGTYKSYKNAITNANTGLYDPKIAGVGVDTVYYVYTTTGGCVDSVKQWFAIKAFPKVGFDFTPNSGCLNANGTVVFTDTSKIAAPAIITTRAWNFGDVTSSSNTASTIVAPHNFTSDNTYTVKLVITANNGCLDSTSITKVFNKKPALTLPKQDSVCENVTAYTIKLGSITNGATGSEVYTSFKNAVTPAGLYDPSKAGYGMDTIYYTVTSPAGCAETVKQPLFVKAKPKVSFTFPQSGCLPTNGAAQFNGTASVQGSTIKSYAWNFDYPSTNASDLSTQQNPIHYYTVYKTYTVVLTATANNGCVGDSTVVTPFNIKPAVSYGPTIAGVCVNGSNIAVNSATITNGVTPTYWSYKATGIADADTTAGIFNPAVAGTGTKTITYSVMSVGGCAATATATIKVFPKPTAAFSAPSDVCLDKAVAITAIQGTVSSNLGGSVKQWKWWYGDNTTPDVKTTNASLTKTYATAGTYTIKMVAVSDSSCVSDTATDVVNIRTIPVASFTAPTFLCMPKGIMTLTAESTNAEGSSMTHKWDFGDATATVTGSPVTHTYQTIPSSGFVNIKLTSTSIYGCADDSVFQFSTFLDKPNVKFTVTPSVVCLGQPQTFTNQSLAPNSKFAGWKWDFGDGTGNNVDSIPPAKIYTRSGSFTIKLSGVNTQGCTSDVYPQTVTVNYQPKVEAGNTIAAAQGNPIQILATANDTSKFDILWTTSTGVDPLMVDPTFLQPSTRVSKTDWYHIYATAPGNCTAHDSVKIIMLEPVVIPNAFSPNGDGVNDRWEIKNLSVYPGATVEIFDRGGHLVYSVMNGYSTPWDGSRSGKPLPVGVYYYIINLKNGFSAKTGYVTILR